MESRSKFEDTLANIAHQHGLIAERLSGPVVTKQPATTAANPGADVANGLDYGTCEYLLRPPHETAGNLQGESHS